MHYLFRHKLRHPFYPELRPVLAATTDDCPAVFGLMDDLVDAAAAGIRVNRAVFPLRLPGDPFLSDSDRDLLWDLFQVPVYALLVDMEGELIGYECEAQDGVHLSRSMALPSSRLETATCECGRPGPRLLPVQFPADLQDQLLAS